jgi:hypothetical protein
MAFIRKQLKSQIEGEITWTTLQSFLAIKGHSKLGDSLVNFIYSLAKSSVSDTPTGTKVSDFILSQAYRTSEWRNNTEIILRGDKGRLADQVEALILFFWIYEVVTIDELTSSLINDLDPNKLHHPREEKQVAINAFRTLLNTLYFKIVEINS